MAGPEQEMPTEGGRGRLRASHADRERVIGTLKAAYVYGLVTKEEFDARVGQTFAARTYADLAIITADIPAGLAPAPPPLRRAPATAPAQATARARAGLRLGERAVVATATLAALLFFAALCAGNSIIPLLLVGATGSGLVSLLLAAAQMSSPRGDTRPGSQLPPRREVHGGPGAGQRPAPAAPAEQLPRAGKSRRPGNAEAARGHPLRPQVSS